MLETALLVLAVMVPLVVGAVWLMGRRMDALAARLDALDRLDELETLAERVRSLSTEVHRKEQSERLSATLAEVTDAQTRTTAAVSELERQVAELVRAAERRVREERVEAPPPAEELAARVRHHLLAGGHADVRLLTDLSTLDGRSGRVVFESRKDGVTQKGHVVLTDGEVADETVRSAYAAFP